MSIPKKTYRAAVKNSCILMFVKYPERGKVKSRLSISLDVNKVLNLYKSFVLDLIDTLKKGKYYFKIFFYPQMAKEEISAWLGEEYSYKPQTGKDLGEKMMNAFKQTFEEGFQKVLIIGSDCPDLTNTVLHEAFESLKTHDAVIGPSFDGGYYLIGFKKKTFLPDIFEELEWGASTVFKKTMATLKKNGYAVHILQKWRDIDRIKDLLCLFHVHRNKNTTFANSRTLSLLPDIFKGKK